MQPSVQYREQAIVVFVCDIIEGGNLLWSILLSDSCISALVTMSNYNGTLEIAPCGDNYAI